MNTYLAKSNPVETIQEHTNNLIVNYELLKTIYPNIRVDWDILYLACLYHDLGKINKKFQDKIKKIKRHSDEIPHGILSLSFLNTKILRKDYTQEQIKLLTHAIAYHHEREFVYENDELEREIESLKQEAKGFSYDKLPDIVVKKLSVRYFSDDRIDEDENLDSFLSYIMIKGLLNRIDYSASAGIPVEEENDFLLKNLNENLLENFKEKDPNADWNDLQNYMRENIDNNVVIVAQTGMGKTEAGLLWIGDNKGFFTLPLRTAINAIYDRIRVKVIKSDYSKKLGLLHSDILKQYLNTEDKEVDIFEYYSKTKQLSLPITICTIDQIFDFVYRYRGFELKLATLSYSKVVIDEVQMYSPELLAYLVIGLYYIDKIGGKFAVLTATLPKVFVDLLRAEGVEFKQPKPFVNDRIRHSIKVVKTKLESNFILDKYNNNKVLVICNTVKEAQRIYKELNEKVDNVNLFHSGFIKKDRALKEKDILEFGKKNTKYVGIWVATSVVEASLDIDFDILITELSDLNGLFQRLGRCYRDRDLNSKDYNCYVFNGGEKKCSGVGSVIDKKIFELSKQALDTRNIDGIITEAEKINLIDELYTTENLNTSKYYEDLTDAIEYLKMTNSFELDKRDVKKLFRNIDSTTIIPKIVFDTNRKDIYEIEKIINKQYHKDMSKIEREILKKDKLNAIVKLDDLTVSTRTISIAREHLETHKITKYLYLNIYDCEYNEREGLRHKERNINYMNIDDKMF